MIFLATQCRLPPQLLPRACTPAACPWRQRCNTFFTRVSLQADLAGNRGFLHPPITPKQAEAPMNHTASIPPCPRPMTCEHPHPAHHPRPGRARGRQACISRSPGEDEATGPAAELPTVGTSGCSTRSATAASSCAGVPPPDPVCRGGRRAARLALPFPSLPFAVRGGIAESLPAGCPGRPRGCPVWPQKAMVRSSSRAMISSARVTPACPARPARREGRPIMVPRAPRAMALASPCPGGCRCQPDLDALAHRLDDRRQRADGRGRAVQSASAMVR